MTGVDCIFCRISSGTIPANIVAKAENLLAFKDINPQAPVHLLIVPTEHIPSLQAVKAEHQSLMAEALQLANRLAREFHVADAGYRLVVNCGPQAGQTVGHLHFHLLGGRTLTWPPG